MLIALTQAVPPSIVHCELTHLEREPIDLARAMEQHRRYEEALVELGCSLQRLPPAPELPDSVFVEDTAVVLPELAIVARPGAESRRAEVASVAEALRPYRRLAFIEAPGTLDGGDVLVLGSRIWVGLSERTNADGIRQLERIVSGFGYELRSVTLTGCLHLKTAVTQIGERTVLLNPAWIDAAMFEGLDRVEVHPDEPFAANALRVGQVLLYPAAFPQTRERLEERGFTVRTIEADELAKAEAGLTCCSVLVPV
ncbi:MAG TPA: arginine deiminase family protein [Longimicrobium sp.]|jgi:dimethylargininase|uniref:dimethylarginine dimethylaminohydrolase family protein n=1 Tax=Longimicrobium sp. TaxID=2029185 RepID=UPI002ED8F8DA